MQFYTYVHADHATNGCHYNDCDSSWELFQWWVELVDRFGTFSTTRVGNGSPPRVGEIPRWDIVADPLGVLNVPLIETDRLADMEYLEGLAVEVFELGASKTIAAGEPS